MTSLEISVINTEKEEDQQQQASPLTENNVYNLTFWCSAYQTILFLWVVIMVEYRTIWLDSIINLSCSVQKTTMRLMMNTWIGHQPQRNTRTLQLSSLFMVTVVQTVVAG